MVISLLSQACLWQKRNLKAMQITTDYHNTRFFDEMFASDNIPRDEYRHFCEKVDQLGFEKLMELQASTGSLQKVMGMTFNVYNDKQGTDRILHLDVIPRIIRYSTWLQLSEGLRQRIEALNLFISDIYGEQRILKDGIVPRQLVESSEGYLPICHEFKPPKGIWSHISGTDLVRSENGEFFVLEDNLRCPSGVSYLLENREILKRTFPQMFENSGILPVHHYCTYLREMLVGLSSRENPSLAILTPGIYNSAYYEHSYLAQQIGADLVEGRDLVVMNDIVYKLTTKGLKRIDVIYRRVDDAYLDPLLFNPDSVLGVPGLLQAYSKGNVAIVNAPGTGIADNKAIYAYVPKIIRYYLGEEPLLNNVPTYICADERERGFVLENLDKLVIKETEASGGYGMLIGPHAAKAEREAFKKLILAAPHKYIAQPMLNLSRVPTIVGDHLEGRHVDLRPYIIYGDDVRIIPGAFTRVALKKDSLVVNSSQGGGSKDTWIVNDL